MRKPRQKILRVKRIPEGDLNIEIDTVVTTREDMQKTMEDATKQGGFIGVIFKQ